MYRYALLGLVAGCSMRTVKFFDDTGSGSPTDTRDTSATSGADTGETASGTASEREASAWTSGYTCWTLSRDEVASETWVEQIDLASGAATPLVHVEEGDVDGDYVAEYDLGSLGMEGDLLYTCLQGPEKMATISLIDGTVDETPMSCEAATNWEDGPGTAGGVVVLDVDHNHVLGFSDLDTFTAGGGGTTLYGALTVENLTEADGKIYLAWFSTDTIQILDIASGTVSDFHPDGWDSYIWGLSVIGDEILLLGMDNTLYDFDLETGARLGTRPLDPTGPFTTYNGLRCVPG